MRRADAPSCRALEIRIWKIVAILMLTVTVLILARFIYKAPMVQTRVGLGGVEIAAEAQMRVMYGGIRG